MDSDARTQNGFLASLDEDDFESLRPHLRSVALTQSEQLVKIGDTINRVFLAHSGVISLVVELDQGELVEVAMIGRDSVLNLSGVLAGPTAVTNAVVMLSSVASTLDVNQLRTEAAHGGPLCERYLLSTEWLFLCKRSRLRAAMLLISSRSAWRGGSCEFET
jgi:CRP-like cAMP-binding protein